MPIASRGATMAVDWEQRVDFTRLRRERLEKAQASLAESSLGALLLFDPNNIRYVTSTHIGEWARDKNARFALLFREGPPLLWDFGSAARHPKLYAAWLPEESWRAGVTSMRGAMPEVPFVPNIAQDSPTPSSSTPKPAFWYEAPLNVPANSRARFCWATGCRGCMNPRSSAATRSRADSRRRCGRPCWAAR